MASNPDLLELARHMEWADAQLWTAVLNADAAQRDERLRLLLYHVHIVQHTFLSLWEQQPREIRDPASFADLRSLARWGRDGHARIQQFLAAAGDATLAHPVHVPWAAQLETRLGRLAAAPTLAQTAVQLAIHSSHHRGQINTLLRDAGMTPPLVDYIAWIWWGQPAAEWPAGVTIGA
jgi:uncharacterized damage-inducible protein DinB